MSWLSYLLYSRGKLLTSVERLLKLAYLYITTVEESYTLSRSFPPHGACFHGFPITLHVICELNKTEFDITTHSNESLKSLRQKIHAKITTLPPDQLQIYKSEMLVSFFAINKNILENVS